MRVLIVNPPHPSIGSRIPREQLPPLGLLSIGGPLIDAGHAVALLDAELGPVPHDEVVRRIVAHRPQVLLVGHSGSTSAHPIVAELTRRIRALLPDVRIVYGGVFPTYHYREVLAAEHQIDVIVRGEGEATVTKLIAALEAGDDLGNVDGIAFRQRGRVVATADAAMIEDLDAYRVGWESDRARPLRLLRRQTRRRDAVLPRLPAQVQLLRPARLLGPLAPPRSGQVC